MRKELIAKENMWLTQVSLEDGETRNFLKKVFTSSPSAWCDATADEKAKWESEHPVEEPEMPDFQPE